MCFFKNHLFQIIVILGSKMFNVQKTIDLIDISMQKI